MIIKNIRIKNFRSYYGDDNYFEFSDKLTVIIGGNGDGKTTFFEALQWLLDTTSEKGNVNHISEMKKSDMEAGDRDEVCVSITFEHDGEKIVEKSFSFEKRNDGTFKIENVIYRGYSSDGVERTSVAGRDLINNCYDAFIQKFSMFKGETELNVFDNAASLKQLVDKFSDIRKFDKLVANTTSFEEKSNKAYIKESQSDKKVAQDAKNIESRLSRIATDIYNKKSDIRDLQESMNRYSSQLQALEDNQEASERYKDIKNRLETQKDKRIKLRARIDVDYNHKLLDEKWILCAYMPILQEFKKKCSALSKERRKQEKDYDRQKSADLAKLEVVKEIQGALINGATELPWYLPNQETMEEMLNDHICKVCGREAPEGSDAYNFMLHKLEEYKRHVEAKLKRESEKQLLEEQELFKYSYIESLHNLSITLGGSNEEKVAKIPTDINDLCDLIDHLRQELKVVDEKIEDLKDEMSRLLSQAGNVSEQTLEKDFNDIKGLFEQKERASLRLAQLNKELSILESQQKDWQNELDNLDPENSMVKVYRDVHRTLELVNRAFLAAQKDNLRRFLGDLQERANSYLERLSANDFHGEIHLVQTANDSTEIRLFSSNGTEIRNPSGSQKTVMYISVLFAISDFTKDKRDEDYPLIFDAATSSFGESKEADFYNVISGIEKQCIIVTKDFLDSNENVQESLIDALNCSVYRIKKSSDTDNDKTDLSKVRTEIKKLK